MKNILLKFYLIMIVFIKSESVNLDNNNNVFGFIKYGNWCGPGHGGYQDCCNNKKCSKCNIKDTKLTDECLNECKPIDTLDYHCAIHDNCCFNHEKDITCFPEGNKCYCDCLLLEGVENLNDCTSKECLYYRSKLSTLFNYGLSCWYKNKNNTSICNKVSMKDYYIKDFCKDGKEIQP